MVVPALDYGIDQEDCSLLRGNSREGVVVAWRRTAGISVRVLPPIWGHEVA